MTSIVISNSAGTAIRHQPENRCMGANAAVCIDTLHAVRSWIGDSGAIGRLQHCTRERERERRAWIGFAHHKIVFARHSLRPPAESFTSPRHFRQDAGSLQDEAGHAEGPEGPAEDLGRQEPAPGFHLLRSQPRHHPRDLPKVRKNKCPKYIFLFMSSYHPQTAQLGPAHHRLHLLSRGALHATSQTYDSSPHHRFSHHR